MDGSLLRGDGNVSFDWVEEGRSRMTLQAWNGTLTFGPWWLLYCGPIGPTELHAHHAFQIMVHDGAPCVADAAGEAIHGPIVIIEPDEPHAIRSRRDLALVVFVEPECRVGKALGDRHPAGALGPVQPVAEVFGGLAMDNWAQADETVRRILSLAGMSEAPLAPPWLRHPAVDEVLLRLPDLVEVGSVDVSRLAATIGISTSRLTHVFTTEVGIPLRSYARWLRLLRTTEYLSEGLTITEAAHAAGFADTAHFSRAFKVMFGLAPSEVMHACSWVR